MVLMMKMFWFLLMAYLGGFCGAAANDESLFATSGTDWGEQRAGALPPPWRQFGGIELNKSTLDEVETRFGTAQKFRQNSKSASPFLLCYYTADGDAIIFESGPLGAWSIVTAISIAKNGEFIDERCAGINYRRTDVRFGRIALGTDIENIKQMLGEPGFEKEDYVSYRFAEKAILSRSAPDQTSETVEVDILSGIEIGFDAKNRVKWLTVYWIESI